VNADTKFDPEFRRHVDVCFGNRALDVHRTARCIDRTGEFDQHAIAGVLDNATAVCGDLGIDERLPKGSQLLMGAFLVATHQPAVAGDIRRQHSRQSSFHTLSGQKKSLLDRRKLLPLSKHRRRPFR
jgi:hypothetical protein